MNGNIVYEQQIVFHLEPASVSAVMFMHVLKTRCLVNIKMEISKLAYKASGNCKMSARNMSHSTETTKDNIVWLDMEMTGLDPTVNHILEIACIITNSSLEEILVGPQLVLHHPEQILASMDQWNTQTHEKTGLLEASRRSSLSVKDAENVFLKFLQDHLPKEKCPLAGNTVYMDRMFLQQQMPEVNNYLHYHNIDVSSVKELCRRWYPEEYSKLPQKKRVHRALDDIRESIEELKFYQGMIFKHQ